MQWYAIHAKPRQESLAMLNLQREGVEAFFPKLRRRRTIRRVRKWVTGPFFPVISLPNSTWSKAGGWSGTPMAC